MRQYLQLTKRDCLVYIRDKGAVFFSLLSMLIVLMLMGVFLGQMSVDGVLELLEEYGGVRDTAADEKNAAQLIQYWTLAGILTINSVTVTLAVMTTVIRDASEKKLDSFYCAPVRKTIVAGAYITSSILLGTLLCIIPLIIALIVIGIGGGNFLPAATIVKLIGCILLHVIIFSIIMYLAAYLVKSLSAWSAIGTIVGTLVGFVGAVYLPMGELPETVGNVLKYLPILHGTSLMRKLCCQDILAKTFDGLPDELIAEYKKAMGITVAMGDETVSSGFQIGFLIICGIIALGIIIILANKRRVNVER